MGVLLVLRHLGAAEEGIHVQEVVPGSSFPKGLKSTKQDSTTRAIIVTPDKFECIGRRRSAWCTKAELSGR
jgi:hypothetical protein